MPKYNREILDSISLQKKTETEEYIKVGMSTCGLAAGADSIYNTLVEETKMRHLSIKVQKCGCIGMCFAEPLVEVKVAGLPTVTYGKVNKDIAVRIVEKHVVEKLLLNECIFEFKYRE
jgi:NADP-reducing hydrogenase subunit HndB